MQAAGIHFHVAPVDVDEALELFDEPEVAALQLAMRKAQAAALRWKSSPACVLGADTIVAVRANARWTLLGKPLDGADAQRMLATLSGTRHLVATGVALVRSSDGALRTAVERTWVTMREISQSERDQYVSSGSSNTRRTSAMCAASWAV